MKSLFLGWANIKWFAREIMKMYSAQSSYFSKKRVESGIAFLVAQAGMIFFLCAKYKELDMSEFLWWAAAEFAVSGYMINAIQKEKSLNSQSQTDQVDQSEPDQ